MALWHVMLLVESEVTLVETSWTQQGSGRPAVLVYFPRHSALWGSSWWLNSKVLEWAYRQSNREKWHILLEALHPCISMIGSYRLADSHTVVIEPMIVKHEENNWCNSANAGATSVLCPDKCLAPSLKPKCKHFWPVLLHFYLSKNVSAGRLLLTERFWH